MESNQQTLSFHPVIQQKRRCELTDKSAGWFSENGGKQQGGNQEVFEIFIEFPHAPCKYGNYTDVYCYIMLYLAFFGLLSKWSC